MRIGLCYHRAVTMPRLTPIIFIFLAVKNADASERPIVTLDPNWNPVYSGDKVTLSCMVGSPKSGKYTKNDYIWYKDGKFHIYGEKKEFTAIVADSGSYECSYKGGTHSVPVQLRVIPQEYLILQTPLAVVEGDHLSLRCRSGDKYKTNKETIFYKGDEKLVITDDILHIPNVTTAATGKYKCQKYFRLVLAFDKWKSAEAFVTVQELFPEIRVDPALPVNEGEPMTLVCVTNPVQSSTILLYTFYKDSEIIRSADRKTSYVIGKAGEENTGRYHCSVQSQDGNVRRKSPEAHILVQNLFSRPEIQTSPYSIREGDAMIVTCHTRLNPLRPGTELHYTFYRDGRTVRGYDVSDTYRVRSSQLEDSGNYTCEVRTTSDTVRKNSNTLHIQIQELFTTPKIRVGPSCLVKEGEQVTLECVTDPKEKTGLKYFFYKDSQIIQSAAIKNIYVIDKAKEENTGSYQCSVQSQDGNVRKNSTNIYILIQNITITMDKDNKDFVYGESLTLNCSIKKGMSPVFLWLHNETVVEKNSEFYQLRDNGKVLYIKSLQSHHAGTYNCKVSNNLADNKPFYIVETFQISQILESHPLGSNIIWPVLGVLASLLLLVVILLFVKRRTLSILFPLLSHQQNSESTIDKDRSRDDRRSANEGTNGPDETDNNQHLYGNVSSQQEEDDISYTYITSTGPTNKKDEPSVVYSVLKPPGASTGSQATQETDDSANVYQNFDAERH